MRRPDGLEAGELDAFHAALAKPLHQQVVCRVLTVDHKFLGTVPILNGQVDITADDPITRRTGPTLLDADGFFDGPSMNLMVQFVYQIRVPALREVITPGTGGGLTLPFVVPFTLTTGTTQTVTRESPVVEVPYFTGPVIRPPSRDAEQVTLECQDRAAIALRGVAGKTYPKRTNVVELIETILREKCGETKFRFPRGIRAKTEDPVTVGREDKLRPLTQCQQLAASIDMQLFWDGAGNAVLREYPEDPSFDATDLVVSSGRAEPPSEIYNRWRVVGKRPKKHTWVEQLPPEHPLSPRSLRVGGVAQQFEALEQNSKLNTKAKARRRAERLRRKGTRALVETRTYELATIPHLDPYDRLQIGEDVATVVEASLPATAAGTMTVGYRKPLRR